MQTTQEKNNRRFIINMLSTNYIVSCYTKQLCSSNSNFCHVEYIHILVYISMQWKI